MHTLRRMKIPSVCWFNDTAGFHAVLQNTAQAWNSLDIRVHNCHLSNWGLKSGQENQGTSRHCMQTVRLWRAEHPGCRYLHNFTSSNTQVPMLSWKCWLCNYISIGRDWKLFSESFTNLQEVPSLLFTFGIVIFKYCTCRKTFFFASMISHFFKLHVREQSWKHNTLVELILKKHHPLTWLKH